MENPIIRLINPKYESLTPFIKDLPSIFENEGTLIYEVRNKLKTYQTAGFEVIVKSFKKPHFINRIVYTFFRRSKARRSFEHALKLLEKDIPTPEPVAYIEEKRCGLLNRSYYISIFEKSFDHIRLYMLGEKKDDDLIRELAGFIFGFHAKGVDFLDISPGNILQKKEEGKFMFSLVDINRMKFKTTISPARRYKSFRRISCQPEVISLLALEYAKCSGLDEAEAKKACCSFFNL